MGEATTRRVTGPARENHMIRAALILAFVGGVSVVSAQVSVPAGPAPAFEVASVKPNTSGAIAQSSQIGKGSVTATNMRLRALIVAAYGVNPDRIAGLPSWTDQERFDIAARAPAGTPDGQLRLMLRTLLAERFRLVARTEMREQAVYALVVARPERGLGPNLRPSTECDAAWLSNRGSGTATGARPCTVVSGADGKGAAYITAGARPIEVLVQELQRLGMQGVIDRPVIDRTGLGGTYDVDLRFAASSLGAAAADAPALPSIFTALQEQLGLKLEPARGPVEVLVIDSVQRPTPD